MRWKGACGCVAQIILCVSSRDNSIHMHAVAWRWGLRCGSCGVVREIVLLRANSFSDVPLFCFE